MTNEDAVNMIGQLRMYISGGGVIDRKLDEAVQMAIEALKELGNQSQEVNNSNDCISRQAALELGDNLRDDLPDDEQIAAAVMAHNEGIIEYQTKLSLLPSVQPTYTEAQLQKMQDMEQAEVEKAFELGREDARAEIIHCGECKHKGTKNCVANVWAAIFGVTVKDDFYCGLAERRTDG